MTRARVLVADSHAVFRSGVRSLLSASTDFHVVESADVPGVLRAVAEAPPAIALVDLELPPGGGLEAVTRLSELRSCHTVVWSYEPAPHAIYDAIRAGASGYLEKTITSSGLVRALRGIANGEAPLSRRLTASMVGALHGDVRRSEALDRAAVLSARERQVLDLVAGGARNRQIAQALAISEFTVKRHVQNILEKLGLSSRQAAATMYVAAFGSGSNGVPSALSGAA